MSKLDPEEHWLATGYFFVVDAEGAEVPGTRRQVERGVPRAQARAIAVALQAGAGPDCYVEFRAA